MRYVLICIAVLLFLGCARYRHINTKDTSRNFNDDVRECTFYAWNNAARIKDAYEMRGKTMFPKVDDADWMRKYTECFSERGWVKQW